MDATCCDFRRPDMKHVFVLTVTVDLDDELDPNDYRADIAADAEYGGLQNYYGLEILCRYNGAARIGGER